MRPRRQAWPAASAALAAAALFAGPADAATGELWELTGYLEPEVRISAGEELNARWYASSRPDLSAELGVYPTEWVDGRAVLEADMRFAGQTAPTVGFDLQEVWVRIYTGPYSFSVGRHIFNWGTIGDYGVTDVLNPQDLIDTAEWWRDRKAGIWALQGTWDVSIVSLQGVVIPAFAPPEIPGSSPYVDNALPPAVRRNLAGGGSGRRRDNLPRDLPGSELEHTQAGFRAYFPVEVGDFAVGVAALFNQVGAVQPDPVDPTAARIRHPRVGAFTVGGTVPFLEGLSISGESLFILTTDEDGTDPFVRNPTIQSAAQFKAWLSSRLQVELGILDQQTLRVDSPREAADERAIPVPLGSPFTNIDPHLVHGGMFYRFGDAMHQIRLAYMLAYENDGHLINPELDFRVVQGMRLRLGAQLFGGPQDRSLGQLESFSNVYLAFRADF